MTFFRKGDRTIVRFDDDESYEIPTLLSSLADRINIFAKDLVVIVEPALSIRRPVRTPG